MTSRRCNINIGASLLLVLIVADMLILVERATGHRQTSTRGSTRRRAPSRTGDDIDELQTDTGRKDDLLRAFGPQSGVTGVRGRRQRAPAAERVAVPEYMWQLYWRQRRANREREYRKRSSPQNTFTAFAANTIRSFVAEPSSDPFTGQLIRPTQFIAYTHSLVTLQAK